MSYTRVNWQDAPSVSTPLSASNLNKMDAGIEQNANDIEALQQHTYDSALDDTSTNAPQTKVVKKAIEDAVESVTIITDPTLSNEGQAADAKATGEAVAQVKNALAAAQIVNTASGAIASFSDGAAMPMESLTVEMNPIQDLHGLDSPYPAGGGVNKMPPSASGTQTAQGVSITSDGKGVYTVSGTATAGASLYFDLVEPHTIASGEYLHMGNSVGNGKMSIALRDTDNNSITAPALSPANRIFDLSSHVGRTIASLQIYVASGADASMTISPMIVASSSQTAWSPYENICPISGRTEVTVTRTGVNVFDEANALILNNRYFRYLTAGEELGIASDSAVYYLPCLPNVTYTARANLSGYTGLSRIAYTNFDLPTITNADNPKIYGVVRSSGNVAMKITTGADAKYIVMQFDKSHVLARDLKVQLELGSTATEYAPYDGASVTVQLGQTVYGGTVDVTGGKARVTYELVDMSTIPWSLYAESSPYVGSAYCYFESTAYALPEIGDTAVVSNVLKNRGRTAARDILYTFGFVQVHPYIWLKLYDGEYHTREEWQAKLAEMDAKIVLPLAEPFDIDITPASLSTLRGDNTVWSDGDSVDVTYIADPKLYIDKKITAAVAALA